MVKWQNIVALFDDIILFGGVCQKIYSSKLSKCVRWLYLWAVIENTSRSRFPPGNDNVD